MQVGQTEHRGWSRILPDQLSAGQALPVAPDSWLKPVAEAGARTQHAKPHIIIQTSLKEASVLCILIYIGLFDTLFTQKNPYIGHTRLYIYIYIRSSNETRDGGTMMISSYV